MVPERFQRYSTEETIRQVAALAGVDHAAWMQDWPLEVADPSRLEEFIDLLLTSDTADNRTGSGLAFELARLVIYSLDAAEPHLRERNWPVVRAVLVGRPRRYAHHIFYWSLGAERPDGVWVPDPEWGTDDGTFAIAPLMRSVLVEVAGELEVQF